MKACSCLVFHIFHTVQFYVTTWLVHYPALSLHLNISWLAALFSAQQTLPGLHSCLLNVHVHTVSPLHVQHPHYTSSIPAPRHDCPHPSFLRTSLLLSFMRCPSLAVSSMSRLTMSVRALFEILYCFNVPRTI